MAPTSRRRARLRSFLSPLPLKYYCRGREISDELAETIMALGRRMRDGMFYALGAPVGSPPTVRSNQQNAMFILTIDEGAQFPGVTKCHGGVIGIDQREGAEWFLMKPVLTGWTGFGDVLVRPHQTQYPNTKPSTAPTATIRLNSSSASKSERIPCMIVTPFILRIASI